MIPYWILVLACVVFTILLVSKNNAYKELKENYKTLEMFIAMYERKYGTICPKEIIEEMEKEKNAP